MAGQLRVDEITDEAGTGSPSFPVGNVGIGTSSPKSDDGGNKLEISNNANTVVTLTATNDTTPLFNFRSNAVDRLSIQSSSNFGANFLVRSNQDMRFGTNNTERMRIDGAGRVTMPFQPAFAALNLDGQTFNAGVLSGAGSAASFNIGGHYNAANGRFTAPIAGRYLFSCGVLVETGSGRLEGQLRINGATSLVSVNGTGTTFDGPTGTVIANLSAGDFVNFFRNSGTAHPFLHDNNYFFGALFS